MGDKALERHMLSCQMLSVDFSDVLEPTHLSIDFSDALGLDHLSLRSSPSIPSLSLSQILSVQTMSFSQMFSVQIISLSLSLSLSLRCSRSRSCKSFDWSLRCLWFRSSLFLRCLLLVDFSDAFGLDYFSLSGSLDWIFRQFWFFESAALPL